MIKDEKRQILKETIKNLENLPQEAMISYLTHYDLLSILMLVDSLIGEEEC